MLAGVAKVDGVGKVSAIKFTSGKVKGTGTTRITGIDPATFSALYGTKITKGPATALSQLDTPGAVVVKKTYADDSQDEGRRHADASRRRRAPGCT